MKMDEFKWMEVAQKEFEKLKYKVMDKQVLAFLDFNKVFQVDCNTSGVAFGVMFNKEVWPITFFSERLDEAKQKYLVYE